LDSAQEAVGKIRAEGKCAGNMEIMELDLASLKSVRDFATLFQIKFKYGSFNPFCLIYKSIVVSDLWTF